MKKIILSFSIICLFTISILAQDAIRYQGVAFDSNGQAIIDAEISILLTVLQGSVNGSASYIESHRLTTEDNGAFALEIGRGTEVTGSFDDIDWLDAVHFLNVAVDPNGGTDYLDAGTTEFVSVPYTFHANVAMHGQRGPQGFSGPTGPQGFIGRQGEPGDDFPNTGPVGDTGPEGPSGPQGVDGPRGETGPPGDPNGPKGLQGIQGPQGDPGMNGGAEGPQGDVGPQGQAGAQGQQGPQGNAGRPGEKGPKGDPGGTQGSPGPAGERGDPGDPNGPPGEKGPLGPKGIAGPQGPQGPDGRPGSPGQAGLPALPIQIMLSTPPAGSLNDIYLDNGSNRSNGLPGFRYYNGTIWIDLH